ncbi:MAG: RidA family protein [Deltaproteobacteria bacterium]|nr:RidA family protein [Deltaproteobacteria bacterium]
MAKAVVKSKKAPQAVGPYSQAIKAGGFIFLSGQIPVDPGTGMLIQGGAAAETRQVLRNLDAVLKDAGASLNDVVKTTVYLKDISKFTEMNNAYAEFFQEPYPARATVEVRDLPKGAHVEIDAVALIEGA